MKILLLGEYSRLHNSLKEGLTALGHEVSIVGTGDSFKNYTIDYSIRPSVIANNFLLRKFKNLTYTITGYNLENLEKSIRFRLLLPQLKGFDHIQLINSDAIESSPSVALSLYKKLLKQNKKISLLICGDETPVIDYYLSKNLKYSILTPYFEDKSLKPHFSYSLKYVTKPYRKLFEWVSAHSTCMITSDMDYELPMRAMELPTYFIPNPINTDTISYIEPEISGKITIFLGINRLSYIKKGIAFFEEALKVIKEKYADKVEIIITENVPYSDYIKMYNRAHILLDQVYSYDQGYNALEAMAKGKVVFTGAEKEFMEHYQLTQRVAVNALPDANSLVNELSYLIENPDEIKAISKRARAFIEKEHNYIKVAGEYLERWKSKYITNVTNL